MIRRILHLAQDDDTSGFFPQLGRWHDRSRYAMWFGTLRPIAPWLKTYMEAHGVRTLSLDCKSRGDYPSALLRLARVLEDEEIDILHTHLFDPSVVGLAAGVLAGTPIRVVTRHYSDYHTRIHKSWHVRLDQFCTWSAHAVVAVSEHTAAHLRSAENAPPGKVHVIPNGIDFERVRISSDDAAARIRTEFGTDHALLLMAARLHPEKGYEHLFAALPEIAQRLGDRVRLLIAGTGTFEAAYRERVRALGCSHLVHFLGFRRDLPDLMAAADLFVLPSVAEAFGLVLAEALYLGTPVVATRTGGIPEIVDDGVNGILVPPGDSTALAEAVARLLTDEPTRRRMRGAGRDKVLAQFRFDTMLQRYEALYETLAETRGQHA
jgi:glycosyltransferase involved in cell wall biosynthesis